MAEISYYDADLSDALEKLNDTMGKLAKAPPGVRGELLNLAEKKLREIVELKKGYQLALRQAPREQARQFREVRVYLCVCVCACHRLMLRFGPLEI